MAFDPAVPHNGQPLDATAVRNQLNALKELIDSALAALDCSNGAPKLPDYTKIAQPVTGNIAFDYALGIVRVYRSGTWMPVR